MNDTSSTAVAADESGCPFTAALMPDSHKRGSHRAAMPQHRAVLWRRRGSHPSICTTFR
jgi:hypothetical protein